jgi:hypothetical protein
MKTIYQEKSEKKLMNYIDNMEFLEYKEQISIAKDIFVSKNKEYGDSFSLFRDISMVEQIEIKLKRIIKIQNGIEMKVNDIGDDIISEYLGIYNYAIQYKLRNCKGHTLDNYDVERKEIFDLMVRKNHDYGSAWETMHIWSLTDLMNVKVQRIKSMIINGMDNKNVDTNVSEGINSNIQDLANYAIFCLIKMNSDV